MASRAEELQAELLRRQEAPALIEPVAEPAEQSRAQELMAELEKRNAPRETLDSESAMARFQAEDPVEKFQPGMDVINTFIGGFGGNVLGGLTGIPGLLVSPEEAEQNIKNVQQSMERIPQTETGAAAVQKIGELIQQGLDIVNIPLASSAEFIEEITGATPEEAEQVKKDVLQNGFSDTLSESVFNETGSPFLGALAKIAPELVPMLLGTFAGQGMKNRALKKQKLFDEVRAGSTDPNIAKLQIKTSPITGITAAKTTPVWQNALKQGFDEGSLSIIQNASKADQLKAMRMVKMLKDRKKNPLLRQEIRPSNVLGESMVSRVKVIDEANKAAASQLTRVARSLSGQKVSVKPAIEKLINDMDDVLAISMDSKLKPIYKGSGIEDLKLPQTTIEKILKRARGIIKNGQADAFRVHQLKKYIDEVLGSGKAKGLAGSTTKVMGDFRKSIDKVLDDQFATYNTVNTTFSETKTALDGLQDILGKRVSITDKRSALALGTLLKQRLMGNAQSRIPLMNAVDDIENIARKYGGTFDDNLKVQRDFVEMLDKTIREQVAPTSLQGEGFKAGRKVLAGNKAEVAADLTESMVNKMRGINDDAAIKAIDEFLQDL